MCTYVVIHSNKTLYFLCSWAREGRNNKNANTLFYSNKGIISPTCQSDFKHSSISVCDITGIILCIVLIIHTNDHVLHMSLYYCTSTYVSTIHIIYSRFLPSR